MTIEDGAGGAGGAGGAEVVTGAGMDGGAGIDMEQSADATGIGTVSVWSAS